MSHPCSSSRFERAEPHRASIELLAIEHSCEGKKYRLRRRTDHQVCPLCGICSFALAQLLVKFYQHENDSQAPGDYADEFM